MVLKSFSPIHLVRSVLCVLPLKSPFQFHLYVFYTYMHQNHIPFLKNFFLPCMVRTPFGKTSNGVTRWIRF
ncbi:hypothetical protein ALPO108162_08605 [Alicyclobacillus pomorum]